MLRKTLKRSGVVSVVAGLLLTLLPMPRALALSTAPDQTWRTNGRVLALAQLGDTIYFGGRFTKVISPTGKRHDALNLAAFEMSTGAWIPTFRPSVTGSASMTQPAEVKTLGVSTDGMWLYVGGKFDTINGQPATNLAAVDTASGETVDPGFVPVVRPVVHTILVGSDRIYFGGQFTWVKNRRRSNLAALLPDGTLDPSWQPSADGVVRTLELAADGNTIFVGGEFENMNGQSRSSVARVTTDTGALDSWAVPSGVIVDQIAWDLLATPTRLYGGFGTGPNYAAAFRLDLGPVGAQVWRKGYVGNIQALSLHPDGSRLFVAGHHGTGRLQQQQCGTNLRGLMMVNPATGDTDCSWIPQLEPWGNNYIGAWALLGTDTQLWVGGKFTSISGVLQGAIARYTL
jgi:hypothetical protein